MEKPRAAPVFANACPPRTSKESEPGRPTLLYINVHIEGTQEESLSKYRF
jgi:hypothetical protein